MNENKNTWDAAIAVVGRKFIALNAYIRNEERSPINNLITFKKFFKRPQCKPKASVRKETRAEINETENRQRETSVKQNLLSL